MDIPVSNVRKVLKIAQEPISLETPCGEEEDSHLGDFIEAGAGDGAHGATLDSKARTIRSKRSMSARFSPSSRNAYRRLSRAILFSSR